MPAFPTPRSGSWREQTFGLRDEGRETVGDRTTWQAKMQAIENKVKRKDQQLCIIRHLDRDGRSLSVDASEDGEKDVHHPGDILGCKMRNWSKPEEKRKEADGQYGVGPSLGALTGARDQMRVFQYRSRVRQSMSSLGLLL